MWKHVKAWGLGFVWFRVRRADGSAEHFPLYSTAIAARNADETVCAVEGFRPFVGWRCFWLRGTIEREGRPPTITINSDWTASAER